MVKFPLKLTDKDKLKFLYRAVDLLRLEHNEEGRKCREGEITEKVFREYQKKDFEPRNQRLFQEINQLKEKLDMFRNYSKDPAAKSPNLIEAQKIAEEGKKETRFDKNIKLKEV
jgi:hypothetical protein